MAVTFDTLEIVEELRASGFTEAQARGISFALKTAQESSLKDLATKADIITVKADISAVKADIIAVKADLKEEISKLSLRINQVESKLSERITQEISKLTERMTVENSKLSDRLTALEGKITLLHWMIALMFAGVVSLVMKAFFMH